MTVPEQVPVTEQVANGVTVKFFVQFQYANKNDLHIYVDGVEPSISEVYFDDNAFNFYSAPQAGKVIKIQRITPKERDTDYDQSDNTFRPRVVNADFDKIWYVLQEVFADIGGLSQAVQDEVIARIQGDEDLLNQLSTEISARILGDEAVTNDLKDYVNQVVGAILNDPTFDGVDASKVNTDSGETQQQVNDRGGATWYSKSGGYNLNDRVILDNGDIVRSTEPNNTVDPNVDMSEWAKDIPINNAQHHGCRTDGTDISAAFVNYANSLPDGSTLKLPEGEYYWDATSGTKSITKNINIDATGSILNVKPNASGLPFLELKSDEVIQYSGTGILNSLSAFNPILDIKGSPLINPCDYFVVLRSTEVLIHRAGFAEDYKKEVTLDIIDNSYRLRVPSPITFTDLSKLTVRFVKKSKPVTLLLPEMRPTEVLPSDGYFLQYAYKYGAITEKLVVNMQDKEGASVAVHYSGCCGLTFNESDVIGGNSDAGTSYAFLNSTSSHTKFERCSYRDSGGAIKKERGHVGRHGYFIEFDSCFFSGVDDHYGWNYLVKNMQMSRGIQFAGGSLTVENCYSSDILVNLREDTPYADGTLKIVNSFGRTHTLKAYGHTAPTALTGDFTKHKVWDVIDIDFDLYSDQMSNSAVVIKEPYTSETDVYRNTILNIKGSFTQRLGIYRVLLDIWLQQNNTTGVEVAPFSGDLASKKLFSQVNIDVKHNKIIDGSTANTTDLIRGAVADEHNFKCNDLHFINVRSGVLNTENSQFKDSRYVNNMSTDVAEMNLNTTWFKPSSKSILLNKTTFPNVKIYLEGVRSANQNILWNMFGDNIEYSKSIFDDESFKAANTWNLRNYRKGLQYEHTLVSDLVMAANSYSSTVLFTWLQATKNDFKVASFYIPVGQVRIEIVNNGDLLDYQTAFRLFNTTGASVTVPAGTKIRFKVV